MLVSKIEDHCDQNFPCQFYMEEFINVQWDKVYIFKEEASLEYINEKMGFAYPFFIDIARRIIFVKNDTIVYHEDIYPFDSVEGPINRELYFILPDGISYAEIPRERAKFTCERVKVKNVIIYRIFPAGI